MKRAAFGDDIEHARRLEHEIAEGKAREAALAKRNAELETKLGERTRQLEAELAERQQAEETLRRSRTAALNLMEDAVEARTHAEQTAAELRREMQERLQAEALAERSRALLMAAVAASPAGMLVAEAPDVRITMANDAALGTRGGHRTDLTDIAMDLHSQRWQTFHLDGTPYDPADLPLSRAVLRGETVRDEEVVIRSATGEARRVLASAAPVRDSEGRVVAGIVVFPDITVLRRAEESLRNLSAAVDSSGDVVFLTDREGTIRSVNQRFTALYGHRAEDVVGQATPRILKSGKQTKEFYSEVWRRLLAGEVVHGEVVNQTEDGRLIDVEETITSFRNERGDIAGFLAIQRDITARKRAETTQRETELRFHTLFGSTPVGVAVIEPTDGRVVEANETAARQLGYSLAELLQLKISDFEAAESSEDTRRHLEALLRSGGEQFATRHRTKNGEIRDVLVTTKLIELSGRKLLHSIFLDITERKEAAAKLAASETQFRALIENASDLVSVIGCDGVIRFVAPGIQRILGYTPDEAIGRSLLEWLHPEDTPRVTAALQRVVANPDRPVSVECRIRRADGEWRTVESIGRNISWQGAAGFILVNSRDVTDQRRLEEHLRQSQKMEGIGQLAGGVAHDFNNLLAAIIMQVELMAMTEELPGDTREGLAEILAGAERAASLTRQLLLFSRRQVMRPRELDLNEIVTNLARMLQRIIGEDVRLQLNLSSVPLWTRADPGMLDQVLMNLAVNARDAMPRGGRLRIETFERQVDVELVRRQPEATPGRCAGLRVSDTGEGIAPEVLPRIFEPFFTTKESGKGTGLGLATVFGIVKQHRGWIEVRSQPGHGTVFEVFLPAVAGSSLAAPTYAAPSKPRGGTETILLAEDDAPVRRLTRVTLERHGYRVIEADSGAEALRVCQGLDTRIALLLTDLVMPAGVSGQQLARRLRADRPELKVIYTSGYSAEIAGKELELHPGDAFVQKPCPPDQLLETVRRCLDS